MKLLQTPLKVSYFENYCSLNKKEPTEGLITVSAFCSFAEPNLVEMPGNGVTFPLQIFLF